MVKDQLEQLYQEVLNESGLRKILREKIPQLDKLEKLEDIKDLKLSGVKIRENLAFVIFYEGTALKESYPHIARKLIERGVIKLDNIRVANLSNPKKSGEWEEFYIGLLQNSLQIFLKVYNPDYQK